MCSLEDNIKMYLSLVVCDSLAVYMWLRISKTANYIERLMSQQEGNLTNQSNDPAGALIHEIHGFVMRIYCKL